MWGFAPGDGYSYASEPTLSPNAQPHPKFAISQHNSLKLNELLEYKSRAPTPSGAQ